MSVLIRGMEMPDNCSQCDAEWEDENPYGDTLAFCCPFIYKGYTDDFRSERRHNDCPLVEVPSKHGRLIDADAFIRQWCEIVCKQKPNCHEECAMYQEMDGAPTVLKAEE